MLQLFFTLTWTVYVIFLPKLAAQVGIRPQAVIVILMLDQVIFAFMDWLMGRMADRWAVVVGRLSRIVAVTTAVSCAAFLLLPLVAPTGSETLFLALTILWSAIGSAILLKLVDRVVGLRADNDQEREGLDLAEHGERAYNA